MPTERYSRIRPNGADSGSRPSALAPSATPRSSGAPRCGVPSVTTSVTRWSRRVAVGRDRAGGAHHQPAHRVPDQRDPADLGRPGGDQVVEQRGEGDAVLRDREPRVGAQVHRCPGGLGGEPGAVAAAGLPCVAVPVGRPPRRARAGTPRRRRSRRGTPPPGASGPASRRGPRAARRARSRARTPARPGGRRGSR